MKGDSAYSPIELSSDDEQTPSPLLHPNNVLCEQLRELALKYGNAGEPYKRMRYNTAAKTIARLTYKLLNGKVLHATRTAATTTTFYTTSTLHIAACPLTPSKPSSGARHSLCRRRGQELHHAIHPAQLCWQPNHVTGQRAGRGFKLR